MDDIITSPFDVKDENNHPDIDIRRRWIDSHQDMFDNIVQKEIRQSVKKIKITEPMWVQQRYGDDYMNIMEARFTALIADESDEQVVDAITNYLRSLGVNRLSLIDKQFVKDMFIKNVPVKPEPFGRTWHCPRCFNTLMKGSSQKFCDECGVRFDWEV